MAPSLRATIVALAVAAVPLTPASATIYTLATLDVLPPPVFGPGLPFPESADPTGINNIGQVVGYTSYGRSFTFDLTTNTPTFFSAPAGNGTYANAINNLGQAVGSSPGSPLGPVFLRDPATGALTSIALRFSPVGINDKDQLLTGSSSGAVVVQLNPATGAVTTVYTAMGIDTSNVAAINNEGVIVGATTNYLSGFVLDTRTGSYSTLSVPGAAKTSATGINNVGQIVGTYSDKFLYGNEYSFVYDEVSATYTTLSSPGADTIAATGINDLGQIVGTYIVQTVQTFGTTFAQESFIATPQSIAAVPEPATIALLASAIVGLILAGSSRRRAET